MLHTQWISEQIPYTGAELRSHFIYDQFNLLGDAIIAFAGPCEVKLGCMVDLEDVKAKSPIYSENMLHFIVEHFQLSLTEMVLRQRILVALLFEECLRWSVKNLRRQGDDLYEGPAKLSVSIATVSPISGLIHTGINISSLHTPVLTRGLEDYKIATPDFARAILQAYKTEMESVRQAVCKVRGVP